MKLSGDKNKIVEAIRTAPTNPTETLFSRRRQAVEIGGDAIVFPLEVDTTHPDFVNAIKSAQQAIYTLIENDFGITGKTWSDKAARHQGKLYKRHKKLHMAFAGTLPPAAWDDFLQRKARLHTPENMAQAKTILTNYLNQPEAVSATIKECKLNPDGHIVVRMDMHDSQGLANCRAQLKTTFGETYDRYVDPEKQKTLAAVITVVDYRQLSDDAKTTLNRMIHTLETDLKKIGSISFSAIEWIFYTKRTLSLNSRLHDEIIHIKRGAQVAVTPKPLR